VDGIMPIITERQVYGDDIKTPYETKCDFTYDEFMVFLYLYGNTVKM
jgi:hypothetical protein